MPKLIIIFIGHKVLNTYDLTIKFYKFYFIFVNFIIKNSVRSFLYSAPVIGSRDKKGIGLIQSYTNSVVTLNDFCILTEKTTTNIRGIPSYFLPHVMPHKFR